MPMLLRDSPSGTPLRPVEVKNGWSVPAAAAGAVYLLVTALLFRDLLPDITTHLYSDVGDPLLNASVLEWSARHLPLSAAWWNFPSFAPLSGVTAFTEHLLVAYPVSAPIIWLTDNAVLAHNVVLLVAFPLNGLAAYFLAREVTRSSSAAFVGGLAFAFAPYHSTQLSHVQMLMAFGMPLALLGLHRYLGPPEATGSTSPGPGLSAHDPDSGASSLPGVRSRAVKPSGVGLLLFGVGWLITALSNAYMLVLFPLFVVCWCAWFVRPREWRRLVPPLVTAAVFTLPVIPLLRGYDVRQTAYGFSRTITEIKAFSADMVGLFGVSHRESLWRGILPNTYEEGALFPGLTILVLSILAVRVCRQPHGFASRQTSLETGRGLLRSGTRALFLFAAVLLTIVLARVWTGPFGWHVGPIPLPPFAPFRVGTIAAVAFLIGILLTDGYRDACSRRDQVMFYATAAVVFWLLALGPQPEWSGSWRALVYGPYWLLIQVPALNSIRVPARAWLPSVMCLSVLAAAGTAYVASRFPPPPRSGRFATRPASAGWADRSGDPPRRDLVEARSAKAGSRNRMLLLAAITIAIVAEGWFFDRHVPAPEPMAAGVIPADAIVLDLPMEQGFWNAIPQYRAIRGGYRAINGYSGYEPEHFAPTRRAIADLRPDALTPFRMLADLYVIVRPGVPAGVVHFLAEHPGAERIHAGPDAEVLKLPRLDPEAPRRSLPLPLPRPQTRPFGRLY